MEAMEVNRALAQGDVTTRGVLPKLEELERSEGAK